MTSSLSKRVALALIVAALLAGVGLIAGMFGPDISEGMSKLQSGLAWPA
jgi:hypothetical protein